MRKVLILSALLMAGFCNAAILADHAAVAEFETIPAAYFDAVRSDFNFFYGHTSHGSQIMTGLDMLKDEDGVLYDLPYVHETGGDLGHNGDTAWMAPTREWLDGHPECNVAMWSWCGGCSDNTEEGIDIYLAAMEQLESEYPAVLFVYMTGHLDGTGPGGNLYARNNQIRNYCAANDKVLFDFADIESWDPDGNWYPDETDACNWCYDWCGDNPCPGCGGCAHSHCFNCYLKGKGFWWMMARAAGWDPSSVDDAPAAGGHLAQNHPNPFNPRTAITVDIENAGWGRLSVYDLAGRRIATLYEGRLDAGERIFSWDGRNDDGKKASSGVYLCRLELRGSTRKVKMTLIE